MENNLKKYVCLVLFCDRLIDYLPIWKRNQKYCVEEVP